MRTIRALFGALLASAVLIAGASTAQASAGHHEHKHSAKAADRKAERKADRKATSTSTTSTTPTVAASPAKANKAAASCTVTSTKPVRTATGATADVTNTCTQPKTLTVSVQAQVPGPWIEKGCKAHPGVCHLITRYPVTVQPGTHPLAIPFQGCRIQVDIKDGNRLVRAAQFGENGCKTRTRTSHQGPFPHHHKPGKPSTTPGNGVNIGTAISLDRAETVSTTSPINHLPRTGSDVAPIVGSAALLLIFGVGLAVAARKRETEQV